MIDTMNNTIQKALSATQRAEPTRSGGEANGVADKAAALPSPPDPEVRAVEKRRRFTAKYKTRIVEEAQRCSDPGQVGAMLRREGLYSSSLTRWRRQYHSGALQAFKDEKRGRKCTRDARDEELERLRHENDRLGRKLAQAEAIIDIQKKVAAFLGNPIEERHNSGSI
jgi:transposase